MYEWERLRIDESYIVTLVPIGEWVIRGNQITVSFVLYTNTKLYSNVS